MTSLLNHKSFHTKMKSGLKEEAFKWRRGKKEKKWEGSLKKKKMQAGSEVAGEGLVELQRGDN